ncbi:NUDIX domain-containing protein [Candidatus Parcubacteria bacterium]|nr:NUDIX domain-containing protein [Candidatus Parcubacteria bacterium]
MEISELRGHQVICSAFIEKDNKFLIVMCPRFKVWRVPGGRTEHGEKLEETLIREMQEETGITFENPKFVGFGQDQQFHVAGQRETSRLIMFFHVKTNEEPKLDPNEAEDFKWVKFDDLKKIENKEGALTDFFKRNSDFSL